MYMSDFYFYLGNILNQDFAEKSYQTFLTVRIRMQDFLFNRFEIYLFIRLRKKSQLKDIKY